MTLTDHPLIKPSERETLLLAWSHARECICDICADAKALLPPEEPDDEASNIYTNTDQPRA